MNHTKQSSTALICERFWSQNPSNAERPKRGFPAHAESGDVLSQCLPVDVSVFTTGTVSRSGSLKTRTFDQIQLLLSSPLVSRLHRLLHIRPLISDQCIYSPVSEWLFVCPASAFMTETLKNPQRFCSCIYTHIHWFLWSIQTPASQNQNNVLRF